MSRGPYRLPRGGLIDRSRVLEFTFDGRVLHGFAGDTLAAALLANGRRVVARSFKFHRPRGVYSAGLEEPNALVQLHEGARALPSARATQVPLATGLAATAQSGWPSVSWDTLRVLDFGAPLFAAGFYNKTFMWPTWRMYEPLVRRMAGLGRTPPGPDPDRYEVRNAHCDALIVGGGVAGLRAALRAADAGERVILVDNELHLGGQAHWNGSLIDGEPAAVWVARCVERLQRSPDVLLLTRTLAVGCYDHQIVTLVESCDSSAARAREKFWVVRTSRLVLASGAIEQPLIFCNNDRPGVMLAGAARRYLVCHAVAPGRDVVIATNNDSAYALARELHEAGIPPLAVLDSRQQPPSKRVAELGALAIPLYAGSMPVDTSGFGALSEVAFGRIGDGRSIADVQQLPCDALLVSGGWNPALHLLAQAGGKLVYREASRALEPVAAVRGIDITGAAADTCTVGPRVSPVGNTARQWVDLLHDVTVADLELAVRENFASVEHVKRFTTLGMSVDQGKTSSPAALEILARLRGCTAAQLGYTTLRPPFSPVSLGAIAGRCVGERFAPYRTTRLQAWHEANGALLEHYGEWLRPTVYQRPSESREQAVRREALAVRTAVGLFDASPLGKIEIRGPDAREFIDRFYVNNLQTLQPLRIRYGLMLRETGVIYDDGTVVALAPDRILITTTSGNANSVAAWLQEWHQCEWPNMRLAIAPVTDQWATLTLAGPRARAVLAALNPAVDLSNEAFPHFGLRDTLLLGKPARMCRVSFSGELSYEINVAPDAAREVWEALLHAGRDAGITPYGVDAVMLLRMEKGYLHIGTDTDGTTIPEDVGWGKAAAAKSRDFIGKRSLQLPEHRRPDRLQLVGLRGRDAPIPVGSHLRFYDSRQVTDGWVTSSGATVLRGEPVSLALLRGGRARHGDEVLVHDGGRIVATARVQDPVFYDPAGKRMYG